MAHEVSANHKINKVLVTRTSLRGPPYEILLTRSSLQSPRNEVLVTKSFNLEMSQKSSFVNIMAHSKGKEEEFVTIILKSDNKLVKKGEGKNDENCQTIEQVGHNFGSGHDGEADLAYRFLILSFPSLNSDDDG